MLQALPVGEWSHRRWLATERCTLLRDNDINDRARMNLCLNVYCHRRKHSALARHFGNHCCKRCQQESEEPMTKNKQKSDIKHGRVCERVIFFTGEVLSPDEDE